MLHAGLALELSRVIVDDRMVEARRGRGSSGHESLPGIAGTGGRDPRSGARWVGGGSLPTVRDLAWRVVEPDAEYLRRRAA